MSTIDKYQDAYHCMDLAVAGVMGRLDVWVTAGASKEQLVRILKDLIVAQTEARAIIKPGANIQQIPLVGTINDGE